jgi:hypothetical protein
MAIVRSAGHDGRVDEPRTDEPRPVAVAVSPRLLCDVVRRTLELDGVPSTEVPEGSAVDCDVALVTAGRERDVHARAVITLAGEGAPGPAGEVVDLHRLREALASAQPRRGQ